MTKPSRYARDPQYGKPPRWDRVYAKYCPEHTDGQSRHVKTLAVYLRDTGNPIRRLLADAGMEPDHIARSMENTVLALWQARARIAELEGKNG
jgi:hypothetical protein